MSVVVRRFLPMIVALWALIGVSACTTVNMTGEETFSNLSHTQKELRIQATRLSKTVWKSVRQSSFFGYLAGMLVNGKDDEPEGPGLVADRRAPSYAVAVAYVEQKEEKYQTVDAQVAAMETDLRKKTLDAQAFVKATQAVVNTHLHETEQLASLNASEVVRGISEWREDKQVIETSIADARRQKATFETAQLALLEKHPQADMSALDQELTSFSTQIDRMIALADTLASVGA